MQRKVSLAQQAFYRLQRLGNTQKGLKGSTIRQLYISCITSIAEYGLQLWWGKRNNLIKFYQPLHNLALRQILGAFKGSPIKAIEIEAAILPLNLRAEKLCNQYAVRIKSFERLHPISAALRRKNQYKEKVNTQLGSLANRDKTPNLERVSTLLAKP